jgi:hypothetical protein
MKKGKERKEERGKRKGKRKEERKGTSARGGSGEQVVRENRCPRGAPEVPPRCPRGKDAQGKGARPSADGKVQNERFPRQRCETMLPSGAPGGRLPLCCIDGSVVPPRWFGRTGLRCPMTHEERKGKERGKRKEERKEERGKERNKCPRWFGRTGGSGEQVPPRCPRGARWNGAQWKDAQGNSASRSADGKVTK